MTYATGLGSLPELLEQRGGSRAVARAFAAEHLPLALATDRDHRVPLASMVSLFHRAAELAGDPLFGLDVGLAMSPGDYGRWARYALQGETLLDALTRLSGCLALHQVGGTLALAPRGEGRVIWLYRQDALRGTCDRQHADHVIPTQIRVVRHYCGASFSPSWVETVHGEARDAAAREERTGVPWRFGQAGSGVVLPLSALRARRTGDRDRAEEPAITTREIGEELRLKSAEGPVERVSAIMALRLLDGQTDIDGAARLSRLGRRTLQRALDREGTSYRALLDRVRMARARALILETSNTVSAIAQDVGYSDAAHFTRAFRRHFGEPPSALRTRLIGGQTRAEPRAAHGNGTARSAAPF